MEGLPTNSEQQKDPVEELKGAMKQWLREGTAAHGSGLEAMTDKERKDIEALISSVNADVNEWYMDSLPGETYKDMYDYVHAKVGSDERRILGESIRNAITAARDVDYTLPQTA